MYVSFVLDNLRGKVGWNAKKKYNCAPYLPDYM